jgi:hypothetical protein
MFGHFTLQAGVMEQIFLILPGVPESCRLDHVKEALGTGQASTPEP